MPRALVTLEVFAFALLILYGARLPLPKQLRCCFTLSPCSLGLALFEFVFLLLLITWHIFARLFTTLISSSVNVLVA